jgi:haloacetate dehalogenase
MGRRRVFEGFNDSLIDVGPVALRVRHAGSGPAVLLIHGHPRTGSTWHEVAPRLVEAGHSVVVPDMRGYGQSSTAEIEADHAQQSKRAVANDLVRLMEMLGHASYAVVGHDRGAYVALRLALDHPDRVAHLVVMDAVPICEALDRCDAQFAQAWYHWFWFAVPEKPERAINADPLAIWRDWCVGVEGAPIESGHHMAEENPEALAAALASFLRALDSPA